MAKTNMSSITKRILAALVMVPVTILVLYEGYPLMDAFVLCIGAALAWEWTNMAAKKNQAVYALSYMLALVCSTMIYATNATIAFIAALTLFVWFKARKEENRKLLTLGVVYISVCAGALLWTYYVIGFIGTLWFFLMVWSVDVGGYIVGSNLKGPKLAPKISPNKTWSGLFGGVLLSSTVSILFFTILNSISGKPQDWEAQRFFAIVAACIAVIEQCGDLIESAIKRHCGVKDSSSIIPGHGGVFDRVDGLIFAAPFVYFFFNYAMWRF